MKACPSCRQEYEDHVDRCHDCKGVALVPSESLPDEGTPCAPDSSTAVVQILSTSSLVEFDMARQALKEAGVPFFHGSNTGGATFAMPAIPGGAPGNFWVLSAPEVAADEAIRIIERLGIMRQTDAWHGVSRAATPGLRSFYRNFAWFLAALLVLGLLLSLLD